MAAYHKVEVSLNANSVEVGAPSPQTVNVVLPLVGPAGPTGAAGATGATGAAGAPGQGVPVGGTTGQVLRKASGTNYDTEWATGGGGVSSWNDLTDKPSTFTPSAHTHPISEVTDLQTTLDGKAASAHTHELDALGAADTTTGDILVAQGDGSAAWTNPGTWFGESIGSIPSASSATPQALGVAAAGTSADFARADHVHALPSAADVGAAPSSGISPSAITGTAVVTNDARLSDARTPTAHKTSHATGGSDALSAADIGAAAASHTHAAADITSGTLDNSRINFAAPAAIGGTAPSTGAFTSLSTAPDANTSALTSRGYSLTGSNAQSLVDLAGTWNTTGTPTALLLNITDTASNSNSLLMNLRIGGSSRFSVGKSSVSLYAPTFTYGNAQPISVIQSAGGYGCALNTSDGIGVVVRGGSSRGVIANNVCSLEWGVIGIHSENNINNGIDSLPDTRFHRDAAYVFAQRNGTNAQESRIYATFTSSTNYQRMTVKSVKQALSALNGASAATTGTFIPAGAVVVGVTTRVATALTGASGYTIGDGTDVDRWGDITGTAIGTTSDNRNWTAGTIECFTAGGEITLTAKTSNFTAGAIEICVFYLAGQAD